jgi:hypothetical protein
MVDLPNPFPIQFDHGVKIKEQESLSEYDEEGIIKPSLMFHN